MKKTSFLLIAFLLATLQGYSQTWTVGTGTIFSSPTSTKIGIGIASPTEKFQVVDGSLKIGATTNQTQREQSLLKFGDGSYVYMGEFEVDDMLSFRASKYNFTNGNVGIGISNPTSKLSVVGRVSIAPSGVAPDNAYQGELVITKPSTSGQYINLVRAGSFPWSIGMVYNTSNFAISQASSNNSQFTNPFFVITHLGNVGIGHVWPEAKLDVAGTVRAHEVKVCMNGCDFVFEDDYNLMGLNELSRFITNNKHLPEIAPAAVMEEEGVNMGELNSKLLQKVEELTLYVIQLNNEIQQLKAAK